MPSRILAPLVLVLVAFTSTAQAQEFTPAPASFTIATSVLLTAAAADIATSTYAFGAKKAHEALLGPTHNPFVFGALKGGMTAAAIYGAERLRKTHPKAAVWYLIAVSSVEFTIAAHNARIGK